MPIVGVVAVRVAQAYIDAEIDLVVLRIPPAGIDDLVCIGRRIDGTVRDPIVHTIVAVVIDPVPKTVGPVPALACVTNTRPRWRRARRRRGRTELAGRIAFISHDPVVKGVIGGGMIEDRFLRSRTWIGRVEERRDCLKKGFGRFRRGAAHAEAESAKDQCCKNVPERSCQHIPLHFCISIQGAGVACETGIERSVERTTTASARQASLSSWKVTWKAVMIRPSPPVNVTNFFSSFS